MKPTQLHASHSFMLRALEERLFTGALLQVILRGETVHSEPYGTLGGAGTPYVTDDTLFDLASLTKVVATTPLWILLASKEAEIIDQSISRWFPHAPPDKHPITPRHLLAHASGLPHWRPYYLMMGKESRAPFVERAILEETLVYPTGGGCLYSDLGFMLLAFIIERQTGKSLAQVAEEQIFEPLGLRRDLVFRPEGEVERTALTRPGEPAGLVNDLNCRALGGVSGHAGLFGTAKGVAALAGEILRGLKAGDGFFDGRVMRVFCTRAGFTPDSTRALGFDTPSPAGSTSGTMFPPSSLGHTGFTGTSLWIDPESETTVVLLTNRVFMGEADTRIRTFRPELHDAVMREICG